MGWVNINPPLYPCSKAAQNVTPADQCTGAYNTSFLAGEHQSLRQHRAISMAMKGLDEMSCEEPVLQAITGTVRRVTPTLYDSKTLINILVETKDRELAPFQSSVVGFPELALVRVGDIVSFEYKRFGDINRSTFKIHFKQHGDEPEPDWGLTSFYQCAPAEAPPPPPPAVSWTERPQ